MYRIFLERKYLPNIYNFLFDDFNQVINEKIQNITKKIVRKKNLIEHTYLILHIEILIYLAIIRNNNKFSFTASRYEIKRIIELCNRNKIENILTTYLKEAEMAEKFVEYIRKETRYFINLSKKSYISLLSRLNLIEFKQQFLIKEIYLINRKFEKEHKKIFDDLFNLIEKYFDNKIDSFDKISIFLILKKHLFYKSDSEPQNKGKNIIVYDIFQRFILEDMEKELKIREVEIQDLVSTYTLKAYLQDNKVKNILTFEKIDLNEYIDKKNEIILIEARFPLEEVDYLEIKKTLR